MQDLRIRNIVIVGGGTAGWMTAAGMSKLMPAGEVAIRVVESEAIGTVGVGEATIPHILYFNRLLGLDENDFIRKTNATFKTGIEFVNWGRLGQSYIHPFGPYGANMDGIHFHHFWLRYAQLGKAPSLDQYNLMVRAARAEKFQRPDPGRINTALTSISYAFHFDASLYARLMREHAEKRGVKRTEGRITQVVQDPESGNIQSVVLESGEAVAHSTALQLEFLAVERSAIADLYAQGTLEDEARRRIERELDLDESRIRHAAQSGASRVS